MIEKGHLLENWKYFFIIQTPFVIVGATSGNCALFEILILGASYFQGGIYGGGIVIDIYYSSFGGGVSNASFLRLPDGFPIDELGGSSLNHTIGITGLYVISFATMNFRGTYPVVSSIMSVVDTTTTPNSAIVLVLENGNNHTL